MTRPLRILFVSGFFPPNAPMGAVRPGKLHDHWTAQGHEVRTIAIDLKERTEGETLRHAGIAYVPYSEPGQTLTRLRAGLRRSGVAPAVPQGPLEREPAKGAKPLWDLAEIYRQILLFPDRYGTWRGPAVRLGLAWAREWPPDLVFSSGPPQSGHMVAARLAARLKRPWIAELRDLWAGNPYEDRHALIRPFLERLARGTLARASACITVTRDAQARMRRLTRAPVLLAYNGYDPADFAGLEEVLPFDPARLTILHAGVIYPGRRDPAPLFEAIARLGAEAGRVRCLFFHDETGSLPALARRHGIEASVEVHERIARPAILRIERQADILLECRWRDPSADGVIPGKLFEYIGARRPILSLGSPTAEAAAIVRENGLGLVSNDPAEIEAWLRDCLAAKAAAAGRLPDVRPQSDRPFDRATQFRKIDALIAEVLAGGAAGGGG